MPLPTTISWPAEWNIDPKAFDSINATMQAVTAKLEEVAVTFRTAYQQHKQNMPHLLRAMISESWYPDFNMPLQNLRYLEERVTAGDTSQLNPFLEDYFYNAADQIVRDASNFYPHRKEALSDALEAHHNTKYTLSIPVFLAQADGISEELLTKTFFTSTKSIPAAVKWSQQGQIDSYAQILLDPLIRLGTIREHTANLGNKPDAFNRHAILHGLTSSYGTRRNSLKGLSLLSYMSGVQIIKA